MRILFVASESTPFAASGGLAEVAGSLPAALCRNGIDCRVVIPMYAMVAERYKNSANFLGSFYVSLGWRRQYCGVFELKTAEATFYFLDNEYYFKRDSMYGQFDDAERFAFFSKAVLEMLTCRIIGFDPDIIHCNDWQTAMLPVYLNVFYRGVENLKSVRTLFTIHNIAYQGRFDLKVATEVAGLPKYAVSKVEYDRDINMMKGAIEESDRINTVSPTYSYEILNPWFSYGLDKILNAKRYKLSGILNGIDVDVYNPNSDNLIATRYSVSDISGKRECKAVLQKQLGLEVRSDVAVVTVISRLVEMKGMELVCHVLDDIMANDVQMVVLGTGERKYEEVMWHKSGAYSGRFCFINQFNSQLSHEIYAGADIFLMPSKTEPCGLAQMIALRYGTLPIVRETGGLFDSVKDLGGDAGNGFTFKTYNAHDMLDAVNRALSLYRDVEKWNESVKNAMKCDFSWDKSSVQYVELYRSMLM